MSEPALATLREVCPRAEIAVLAKPAVAELFQGHPAADRLLVYESPGRHAGLMGKWRLARTLGREGFDMAVLLQNAFEAGLLAWLARVPRRRGYATDGRGWLLTDRVPVPRDASGLHQAEYFFRLVDPIAPMTPIARRTPRRSPRLYITQGEQQAVARRLEAISVEPRDLIVGLNPGSTYGTAKRWLPERFAETADGLVEKLGRQHQARVRVVIVGARGEEAVGDVIARRMTHAPIRLAGQTTVRELMALVQRCHVFVTNDTGPMHVAAAFGVPVVAIFGPTDPTTTSPAGGRYTVVRHPVDCAPCLLRECPIDHRCMTGVTVDAVVDAATSLLQVDRPRGSDGSAGPTGPDGPATVESPASPDTVTGVTIFVDRDGTLNRDTGYIRKPEELELFPDAGSSLARLNRAGARVVVITNQSGVGRGYLSSDDLARIHARLGELLAEAGAGVDGIYACPHHPDDGCACRKPGTALVERAVADLGLDLSRAYVIGDKDLDMALARHIGAKGILVTREFSLSQAVDWIMEDARAGMTEQMDPRQRPRG